MKAYRILTIFLFSFFPLSVSFAASPEQCYSYFTELVRSSNYPFKEWNVKPQKVNLIIDEDDNSMIRAKLVVDTDGTGTIGWVVFNKSNNELLDTTIDPENPQKLTYNNEFEKARKYCLSGNVIYQVQSNKKLYFFEKTDSGMKQTKTFIINGDYVHLLEKHGNYSQVSYETRTGSIATGWVDSNSLRMIDFNKSW